MARFGKTIHQHIATTICYQQKTYVPNELLRFYFIGIIDVRIVGVANIASWNAPLYWCPANYRQVVTVSVETEYVVLLDYLITAYAFIGAIGLYAATYFYVFKAHGVTIHTMHQGIIEVLR